MSNDQVQSMRRRGSRKFAMISTYPPTACGIATFAAALGEGLEELGDEVGIVRVGGLRDGSNDRVVAQFSDADGSPWMMRSTKLHQADVVVVQHEYGIYPGNDGESIVAALETIERPTIVVAHTVLQHPTSHQRSVLENVVRLADAVVVMTEAGRARLCKGFDVDPSKISVIPHGAAVGSVSDLAPDRKHPLLLTWGLLVLARGSSGRSMRSPC